MRFKLLFAISIVSFVMIGCASKPPQAPIAMSEYKSQDVTNRIGVLISMPSKADTYFPGADCLLCFATASVANSSLTSHTQSLPMNELVDVKGEVIGLLKKKGYSVKDVSLNIKLNDLSDASKEGSNLARKDFTSLKSKLEVDKLLFINISTIGLSRNYSAYVPTADPKAVVSGTVFIVNLTDNSYEWYQPLNVFKATPGKWDEPAKFPSLTNAYFQAIEEAKDIVKQPFMK